MSASAELQKMIRDTLLADAAIMAPAGGVYDRVPSDPWKGKTAYISFGPSDVVDDDAECIRGGIYSVQIDVWSRDVGQLEAKRIVDLVHRALHDRELALTANALASMRVGLRRVFLDADGLTTHGAVSVTASIEEAD